MRRKVIAIVVVLAVLGGGVWFGYQRFFGQRAAVEVVAEGPEGASVVQVQVSSDIRHAKIFVSVLGDAKAKQDTIKALQGAAGHLRSELAHRMRLRYMPELHFQLDESIEHGQRIAQLLVQVREEQQRNGREEGE